VLRGVTCLETIGFEATATAPEDPVGEPVHLELRAEYDMSPGLEAFHFDDGPEGWTPEGAWSLSDARSWPVGGGMSFHSGSEPNQCDTLISPPLTLHPTLPSTLKLATGTGSPACTRAAGGTGPTSTW